MKRRRLLHGTGCHSHTHYDGCGCSEYRLCCGCPPPKWIEDANVSATEPASAEKDKDHGAELAAAPTIPDVAATETASDDDVTVRSLVDRLGRVREENKDKPLRFVLFEGDGSPHASSFWLAVAPCANKDGRLVFLQSENDPPIIGGTRDDIMIFVKLCSGLTIEAKPAQIEYSLAVTSHAPDCGSRACVGEGDVADCTCQESVSGTPDASAEPEPEVIKRTGPHPLQALYDDPAWRESYFSGFTKRELVQMLTHRRDSGNPDASAERAQATRRSAAQDSSSHSVSLATLKAETTEKKKDLGAHSAAEVENDTPADTPREVRQLSEEERDFLRRVISGPWRRWLEQALPLMDDPPPCREPFTSAPEAK